MMLNDDPFSPLEARIRLVAVSDETLRLAELFLGACEACNAEAEIPFDWVLYRITGHRGSDTDYLLPASATCPNCGAAITEKTLVEWQGGMETPYPQLSGGSR